MKPYKPTYRPRTRLECAIYDTMTFTVVLLRFPGSPLSRWHLARAIVQAGRVIRAELKEIEAKEKPAG